MGQLEKFDFNVNELIASKKISNPQTYETKFADLSLVINDKIQSGKTEEIRFIATKDKILSLISGILLNIRISCDSV